MSYVKKLFTSEVELKAKATQWAQRHYSQPMYNDVDLLRCQLITLDKAKLKYDNKMNQFLASHQGQDLMQFRKYQDILYLLTACEEAIRFVNERLH